MSSVLPAELIGGAATPLIAGWLGDDASVERIAGGRNSRVYRVTAPGRPACVLKAYFAASHGSGSRLGVELAALEFLHRHGVTCVPRPIASEPAGGCALYEYVEGASLGVGDIGAAEVDAAVAFVLRLKDLADAPAARMLPPAAEAWFSFAAVAANIAARLERLRALGDDVPGASRLHPFLHATLAPGRARVLRWAQERAGRVSLTWAGELESSARTLSPSDFGFHNARRRTDGEIIFLDFEYFGWDDPAKLLADFVLHPANPVDDDGRRRFVREVTRGFARADLVERFEIAYPLFGLKWCLILLNEFIPAERRRRTFAATELVRHADMLDIQLAKAGRMLDHVLETYERCPYRP